MFYCTITLLPAQVSSQRTTEYLDSALLLRNEADKHLPRPHHEKKDLLV